MKKPKTPAPSGPAGRARKKLDDLPGLIPLTLVAEKIGSPPT